MKPGYLFISNSTKPSAELYASKDPIKIDTFGYAPIKAATEMGYSIFVGINRKFAEEIKCPNFDVTYYDANIFRSIFAIGDNLKAYKNLCGILRKHPEIEVIHCNTPIGGVLGRICGKRFKKKVIYTAHGFHFYKGSPLLNWLLFYPVEKLLAHWTDTLITINAEDFAIAQSFRYKAGGGAIYVPGVGIDLNDYKFVDGMRGQVRKDLGLNDDDIAVFSMGDMVARKNYEPSIRAIHSANNPNIHLFICGEGTDKSKMEMLAKKLNVEENVHFLGFRRDIKSLLQGADIFLLTSKQEGLPRSLMEGMAFGLPCVVSRIRGNVDLISEGEGGFLCDVNDYEQYADCLNKLSKSQMLRKEMGNNNLKTIKKYQLSNICAIVLNVFKKNI